jgi:hypothetical protein
MFSSKVNKAMSNRSPLLGLLFSDPIPLGLLGFV